MSCLWYCKSTIFQANHNRFPLLLMKFSLFVILQKYDFSSKSQLAACYNRHRQSCLWYCKSTIFQANHNSKYQYRRLVQLFVILQKYDFSSKSQRRCTEAGAKDGCLWYCKSTIFQANHNRKALTAIGATVVCDTAKVRFFKQITTFGMSL